MGTYVYSTRKPTREILYMGIMPTTVFQVKYAYKPLHTRSGDYGHAANMRKMGRMEAQAKAAVEYHTEQGNRTFVWGDFEDGDPVYELQGEKLFTMWFDSIDLEVARCKKIGNLYKIAGRWNIEADCPEHNWNYNCWKGSDPAKICTRCGRSEYVDADKQAAFIAKYPEAV